MKKMKRTIGLVLVVMILLSSGSAVMAANDLESDSVYSVQYVGLQTISASLSINGFGIASVGGGATCSVSNYTVYLTVALEKLSGGSWSTVTYWTSSGTGFVGTSISQQYAVARGTYRVRSTATVFNAQGGYVEQASGYSASVTY